MKSSLVVVDGDEGDEEEKEEDLIVQHLLRCILSRMPTAAPEVVQPR